MPDANPPKRNLEIRPAQASDVAALKIIEDGAFSDAWSDETLANLFASERNVTLVALRDGEVAGYIAGSHVCDEAEIARLAVRQEMRRQGIASALLAAMMREWERLGIVKVSLEVRVSNDAGFAIYHKFGFAARGRRPHYYADNEDALVMVKGEL